MEHETQFHYSKKQVTIVLVLDLCRAFDRTNIIDNLSINQQKVGSGKNAGIGKEPSITLANKKRLF